MVEILLFKPHSKGFVGLFEKAICLLTKSEYCHTGILLETGYKNTVAQALPQGFTISDYGAELDTLIALGYVDVYVTKEPLRIEQESVIRDFCYKIKGSPYDWLDILDIAVRLLTMRTIRLGQKGKFICSEAVDLAFTMANVDLVPGKDSDLVTPEDIAESSLLEKVVWKN